MQAGVNYGKSGLSPFYMLTLSRRKSRVLELTLLSMNKYEFCVARTEMLNFYDKSTI